VLATARSFRSSVLVALPLPDQRAVVRELGGDKLIKCATGGLRLRAPAIQPDLRAVDCPRHEQVILGDHSLHSLLRSPSSAGQPRVGVASRTDHPTDHQPRLFCTFHAFPLVGPVVCLCLSVLAGVWVGGTCACRSSRRAWSSPRLGKNRLPASAGTCNVQRMRLYTCSGVPVSSLDSPLSTVPGLPARTLAPGSSVLHHIAGGGTGEVRRTR
jgi:hypothetical protein